MTDELTWVQIVAFAEAGQCWLCPKGGFRKLSQHLAGAHGLHADTIRERYGIAEKQGLCTREYSEEESARATALGRGRYVGAGVGHGRPREGVTKRAQNRAAMAEVANRPNVKDALVQRNKSEPYKSRRAEGLRTSELAAEQRDKAREKRWAKG